MMQTSLNSQSPELGSHSSNAAIRHGEKVCEEKKFSLMC